MTIKDKPEVSHSEVQSNQKVDLESGNENIELNKQAESLSIELNDPINPTGHTSEKGISSQKSNDESLPKLNFVDQFLSLWILIVMILGVVCGYYAPNFQHGLESFQILDVSLPVAFGLWFMMYPVLVKVNYESLMKISDFRSIFLSLALNWIIGPLLCLGLAWAALPDLPGYRNGVIMVGLARCIAMVLIWNDLAGGDREFCVLLVAVNSILQIILYSPLSILYIQVIGNNSFQTVSYWLVCRSVLIFLGIPLVTAIITRYCIIYIAGRSWFERVFLKYIGPLALIALLWTIFAMFTLQGANIVNNIGNVCRVAVPMILYFLIMWSGTFGFCHYMGVNYELAVTQAFTASSNNFELAIAVAVGTWGIKSEEALAATVGPLTEVPVLLSLVYVARWIKKRYYLN